MLEDIEFRHLRVNDGFGNPSQFGGLSFGFIRDDETESFKFAFAKCSDKDKFSRKYARALILRRIVKDFDEIIIDDIKNYMFENSSHYFPGIKVHVIEDIVESLTIYDIKLDVLISFIMSCVNSEDDSE